MIFVQFECWPWSDLCKTWLIYNKIYTNL